MYTFVLSALTLQSRHKHDVRTFSTLAALEKDLVPVKIWRYNVRGRAEVHPARKLF